MKDAPKDSLIVFAKIPEPGKVKTRLTSAISPEWAANLYAAFLKDALESYVELGVSVRLYLAPPLEPLPVGLVPESVSIHEQIGIDLGARMQHAFVETFMAGYQRTVIIGTDHPTLPMAFIEQSFSELDRAYTITIGPSEDGGYYLLGMNEYYPQVFEEMTYSHDSVFKDTVDRIGHTKANLVVLPTWYDVDTPETLVTLANDLVATETPLPHTRMVMQSLEEEYPELMG